MFRLDDGSIGIVDYKTAKLTDAQDSLMPSYQVQLNAYAWIAERCGFMPVSKIGLVYFQPVTDITADDTANPISDEGFDQRFKASSLSLPVATGSIERLLRRARELVDLEESPEGRAGCKDCEAIDNFEALLGRDPACVAPSVIEPFLNHRD